MIVRWNKQSTYSCWVCVGIFLMIFADLFADISPKILSYTDEMVSAACIIILIIKMFRGKISIKKYSVLMFFIVMLGLLSSMLNGMHLPIRIILADCFLFIKPYVILFCFYLTLTEKQAVFIYKFMTKISKILLILMALFSIVTMIKPLGMRSVSGTYQFLSGFSGVASWWTILFLAVITSNPKNKRSLYYLLSVLIILQTKSGLGGLTLVLAIWLYFFMEKQKKFNWYHLILIVPFCLVIGRNEIAEYFMNNTAPRFLLFYYAFVTANTYFPLGAGFATYGSMMAISNYSQLYYKYGFSKRWGMSEKFHPFLMDSYYPQIIGQFGYIGFLLYAVFMFNLLTKQMLKISNKNCRCSCLFLFMCWCIAGFGFGTASYWGCTIYLLIAVFLLVGEENVNLDKKISS